VVWFLGINAAFWQNVDADAHGRYANEFQIALSAGGALAVKIVDDVIRKYADQWGLTGANSVGYLCGHPEMVEHAKGILKRIGFNKENLKEEVYWPAKAAGEEEGHQ
jgi:hypothetical protein